MATSAIWKMVILEWEITLAPIFTSFSWMLESDQCEPESTAPAEQFAQKIFSANHVRHFVSCDPPNNALLAAPPQNIVLSFSCDLGSGSFISATVGDREMVTGPMITARDNRALSAAFNQYAPSGNYQVKYTVYWCDGSYFDGSYGFSILRKDSELPY